MREFGRGRSQAWSGAVNDFLADRHVKLSTASRYVGTLGELATYLDPLLGADGVLDKSSIVEYVQGLTRRGLAPATTAAHLRRVRTFLEWLEPSAVPATVPPPDWAFVNVLVDRFDELAQARRSPETDVGYEVPSPIVVTLPTATAEAVAAPLTIEEAARVQDRIEGLERRGPVSERWTAYAKQLPDTVGWAGLEARELGQRAEPPIVVNVLAQGDGGGEEHLASANGDEPAKPTALSGRRYLEGSAKASAAPGEVVVADLRITLEAGTLPHAALDLGAIPRSGIDIDIVITAPGFKILTPNPVPVHVPQTTDSETYHVELEAVTPGRQSIVFAAFRGGTYLGALALEVGVDAGLSVETAPTAAGSGALSGRPVDPDELSLLVSWRPGSLGGQYIYKVQGQGAPQDESESEVLLERVDQPLDALVELLDDFARDDSQYSDAERDDKILNYGAELWARFVPDVLKNLLLGLPPNVKRLTVIGKNDPLPWELFLPAQPGGQPLFLSERFEMTRWSLGRPAAVPKVRSATTAFVVPPGSPPTARREVTAIRGMGSNLKRGRTIATLGDMVATLNTGDFDLLHVASHNIYGAREGGVPFGGRKRFAPTDMAYVQGIKSLAKRSPLIFMNACRTAGKDVSYTSLAGWADRFIDAGAGAFVGTSWAVRDTSALKFSEAFYGALIRGASMAAAATAARAAARASGDPSWLAYAVYADPTAMFDGRP
jgi:hypothetical protein